MKTIRIIFMLITIIIINSVSALAAGKLAVVKENFHVINMLSSIYGYAYARVQNIGDKPMKVNAGLLEIFDANGNTLTSDDYISLYAEYLNPGEYTYAYIYEEVEGVNNPEVVHNYLLTISGKSDMDSITYRLPVETAYTPEVSNGLWNEDYMLAGVTNNYNQVLFGVEVVMVLLDNQDNILYIAHDDMYSSKGISPGSSVVFRQEIPSNFKEYFAKKGYVPSRVDAIAFINVRQ